MRRGECLAEDTAVIYVYRLISKVCKTIITFLFDSVFTWCVNVPTAWLLVYRTGMGIVPLYFCVQALELIKVVIGFALVKKGVWIHNIVAPVAEKEAAEK